MRIVVWGVNSVGKYLINNISDGEKKVRPAAFIDNNPNLHGTEVDGVQVISYEEFLKWERMDQVVILLAFRNAEATFQVFQQLENMPVRYLGVVKSGILASKKLVNPYSKDGEVIWKVYGGDKCHVIPRLEVSLINACNLKCKGCSHFASIYKEDTVYLFESFVQDLHNLRKVGKISRIVLLGGEPFLLKNLDEYIMAARKIFPEADIQIITNGILIPKVDERIMLSIRENNAFLTITPYKPTLKSKNEITESLYKYRVWWRWEGENEEVESFMRTLTLGEVNNAERANKACTGSGCLFLRRGKLYKCVTDALINEFYHYYGLDESNKSGVDVCLDADYLYQKIVNYALNPVEMCKHCVTENPEWIPWSVKANPALEDWLYKDGAYDASM